MKIIAVDPGQKGGIAILHPEYTEVYTMPDSPQGIIDLLNDYSLENTIMVVELSQPMPKQGVVSSFTYGRHFGGFEWYAYMKGIRYEEVRPNKWKKDMGLNSDKLNSINLCERLFPTINLIPEGCRKKHDGMAEALLIAEWMRANHERYK